MSTTSSINGVPAAGAISPDTIAGGPQQTLTQNNFLQLLVAQMQNQDPTNPQSDTAMAAQMAQFTSLTQSSAMSASLSMLQANSLVGSTVTVQTDSQGHTASGVVQSVQMGSSTSGGLPEILINGTPYNLSQVLTVAPTPAAGSGAGSSSASNSTTTPAATAAN